METGYIAPGSSTEAIPEDRGEVWRIPCTRQFRPDIDENLHGIVHTELPGVCVTFDRDSLPEGDYLIGFLWEDTCSRQKLLPLQSGNAYSEEIIKSWKKKRTIRTLTRKKHYKAVYLANRVAELEDQVDDLQFKLNRIKNNPIWKASGLPESACIL